MGYGTRIIEEIRAFLAAIGIGHCKLIGKASIDQRQTKKHGLIFLVHSPECYKKRGRNLLEESQGFFSCRLILLQLPSPSILLLRPNS